MNEEETKKYIGKLERKVFELNKENKWNNKFLKHLPNSDNEWLRLLGDYYQLQKLREKDQETIEKLLAKIESDRHILEHFTTK